eukprot:gnl/MRDRNA2_/MRDRNA2_61956_c0_seq1.p2 gnl/MRDRNA2_/MRDRNA2_61956_c0~~gnl/MRDRNA2_/MRDRNA2_61956_c0_seq1.p2  ORF type:complete len:120 (-),score=15.09 gnl/MRDRNA2_/MRDRNA2_61956_c0_seq1:16-375(-)
MPKVLPAKPPNAIINKPNLSRKVELSGKQVKGKKNDTCMNALKTKNGRRPHLSERAPRSGVTTTEIRPRRLMNVVNNMLLSTPYCFTSSFWKKAIGPHHNVERKTCGTNHATDGCLYTC